MFFKETAREQQAIASFVENDMKKVLAKIQSCLWPNK